VGGPGRARGPRTRSMAVWHKANLEACRATRFALRPLLRGFAKNCPLCANSQPRGGQHQASLQEPVQRVWGVRAWPGGTRAQGQGSRWRSTQQALQRACEPSGGQRSHPPLHTLRTVGAGVKGGLRGGAQCARRECLHARMHARRGGCTHR